MKDSDTFDIYLSMGSFTKPDLDDLVQRFPRIAEPETQQRMKADVKRGARFLELDLPEETALDLLRRLKAGKAVGSIVNTAYRQPKISSEEAAVLAEKALDAQIAEGPVDKAYGPIQFQGDSAMTWSFYRSILNLPWPRPIPGALFVEIDKLDGHVWQSSDYKNVKKG